MISVTGTVYYRDGRVVEFARGSSVLVAWERYALRHGYPTDDSAPRMLSNAVIAHAALDIAEGFDVWFATVDSVEGIDVAGVPPTPPEPSPG